MAGSAGGGSAYGGSKLGSTYGSRTGAEDPPAELSACAGRLWVLGQCICVLLLGVVVAVSIGLPYLGLCWVFWEEGGAMTVSCVNVAVGLIVSQHLQRLLAAFFYIFVKRCTPLGAIPMGEYQMYGAVHFRLWLLWRLWDRCLGRYSQFGSLSLLGLADGTRCLARFYRTFLGADGIHPHAELDLHSGLGEVLLPEYVKIGAGTVVNWSTKIRPFSFHRGVLTVRPVTVGSGCHLGPGCMLLPGTAVDAGGTLGPLSVLQPGSKAVRQDEIWVGNPPKRVRDSPYKGAENDPLSDMFGQLPQSSMGNRGEPLLDAAGSSGSCAGACCQGIMVLLMPLVITLTAVIAVLPPVLVWSQLGNGNIAAVAILLAALTGDVCLVFVVKTLRLNCVGRLKPGCIPRRSCKYSMLWSLRQTVRAACCATAEFDSTPLRDGLESVDQGRSLGLATFGKNVAFGADSIALTMVSGRNHLYLNKVDVGDGANVGEGACLMPSTVMCPHSSLGANSLVIGAGSGSSPLQLGEGSFWFGAPAVEDNREQLVEYASEPPQLHCVRIVCAVIQALLLKSLDLGLLLCLVWTAHSELLRVRTVFSGSALLKLSSVYLAYVACATVLCIMIKWAVVGKVRTAVMEHCSVWCIVHDMVMALLRWPQGHLVSIARGTVIQRWYFSALGAHIGRGAYLEVDALPEPDLVHIAEDVVIMDRVGFNASSVNMQQGRLVRTLQTITVQRGAHVDCGAQLMPGCKVSSGASVGGLAVVKADATVGAGLWAGVPAQSSQWAPEPVSAWAKKAWRTKTFAGQSP